MQCSNTHVLHRAAASHKELYLFAVCVTSEFVQLKWRHGNQQHTINMPEGEFQPQDPLRQHLLSGSTVQWELWGALVRQVQQKLHEGSLWPTFI